MKQQWGLKANRFVMFKANVDPTQNLVNEHQEDLMIDASKFSLSGKHPK